MSILTPAESHNFQSFLSSMDYNDSNNGHNYGTVQDWSLYSAADLPDVLGQPSNEALAKATKDLMSLDSQHWEAGPSTHMQQQRQHDSSHTHYNYYPQHEQQLFHNDVQQQQRPHLQQQPRRNVTFPFLNAKKEQSQLHHSMQPQHPHLHPISTAYNGGAMNSPYSSLPTPSTASSSSTSSYTYMSTPLLPTPVSPTQSIRVSRSPKRSFDSGPMPVAKRQRPSPPHTLPPSRPSSSSASASYVAITATSKPALLSPSQKKANHIQSEQKRRANIRRGYEALCETVPALREAIRQEETAQAVAKDGKSKTKRGKSKAKADDSTGEKIDGRAGPRSENVVLMKTIDYVTDLLGERTDLMARLERARSSLPPSHPALQPSIHQALWEREWKGGESREEDDEDSE